MKIQSETHIVKIETTDLNGNTHVWGTTNRVTPGVIASQNAMPKVRAVAALKSLVAKMEDEISKGNME